MKDLLAFVLSHGFEAVLFKDKICMEVPFTNIHTGEQGFFTYSFSTLRDARIALGY